MSEKLIIIICRLFALNHLPLGYIGCDCYELPAYPKVSQMNFDIQFWKQCCSVMQDWRNFKILSFESIMFILYNKSMTTVIHPTTWSHHPLFHPLVLFFLTHCIGPHFGSSRASTLHSAMSCKLATLRDSFFGNVPRCQFRVIVQCIHAFMRAMHMHLSHLPAITQC